MMEIPLFPLPNLVLFPQVMVPLHIFEERYKLMIERCIDLSEAFGLVLLRADAQAETEETIHRVGVTARVVQAQRLDEGRFNILCAGESRFRILRFTGMLPYWTARVEIVEDDEEPEEALQALYERVAALYRRLTELSAPERPPESAPAVLPASPAGLSYMIAYALDMQPLQKQMLLEATSVRYRLETVADRLEEAVRVLEIQVARRGKLSKAKENGDLGKPGH